MSAIAANRFAAPSAFAPSGGPQLDVHDSEFQQQAFAGGIDAYGVAAGVPLPRVMEQQPVGQILVDAVNRFANAPMPGMAGMKEAGDDLLWPSIDELVTGPVSCEEDLAAGDSPSSQGLTWPGSSLPRSSFATVGNGSNSSVNESPSGSTCMDASMRHSLPDVFVDSGASSSYEPVLSQQPSPPVSNEFCKVVSHVDFSPARGGSRPHDVVVMEGINDEFRQSADVKSVIECGGGGSWEGFVR
eukprot:gene10198-15685_t